MSQFIGPVLLGIAITLLVALRPRSGREIIPNAGAAAITASVICILALVGTVKSFHAFG
jgi:hypothetical protein